jgi:hypothetical protein
MHLQTPHDEPDLGRVQHCWRMREVRSCGEWEEEYFPYTSKLVEDLIFYNLHSSPFTTQDCCSPIQAVEAIDQNA